jgi:hypothetical protein
MPWARRDAVDQEFSASPSTHRSAKTTPLQVRKNFSDPQRESLEARGFGGATLIAAVYTDLGRQFGMRSRADERIRAGS